jgi:hypothetical protein
MQYTANPAAHISAPAKEMNNKKPCDGGPAGTQAIMQAQAKCAMTYAISTKPSKDAQQGLLFQCTASSSILMQLPNMCAQNRLSVAALFLL